MEFCIWDFFFVYLFSCTLAKFETQMLIAISTQMIVICSEPKKTETKQKPRDITDSKYTETKDQCQKHKTTTVNN